MVALTSGRNTVRRTGDRFNDPLAANVRIFEGALVALNAAGFLVPGTAATGLKVRGVALQRGDTMGAAAGSVSVEVDPRPARFENSAGADAITRADIGADAWIVDDQTVARTAAVVESNPTRSRAGKIIDVDAQGVWIAFG